MPAKRPGNLDCVAASVTFREAPNGVGKEANRIEDRGMGDFTAYTECPAAPRISPELVSAWQQYYAAKGSRPIHAALEHSWTSPEAGFLYRYYTFTLYFRDCDFWRSIHSTCAPVAATANAGAQPAASR
jgi:hypothetical protein